MKQVELKIKSVAELQKLLAVTRAQLFAARYRNATGNLTKSHQVPMLKRQVARILGLLRTHAVHARNTSPVAGDHYQVAVEQIDADTKAFRARLAAKLRARQEGDTPSTPASQALTDGGAVDSSAPSAPTNASATVVAEQAPLASTNHDAKN